MYLLDTNIVSYWMRGHRLLLDRIKSHSPKDLSISAITLAEIYYGIEKSPVKKKEWRIGRTFKIKNAANSLSGYLTGHPFCNTL